MNLRDRTAAAALTYALLATWVVGVLVVVLAAAGVRADHETVPWWVVALAVVLGVGTAIPVLKWIRPAVDAVLFSHPDDANELIAQVGRRFQDRFQETAAPADREALVEQIAGGIGRRLRLEYVAIVTGDEPPPPGADGRPPVPGRLVRVPLAFAGQPVGTLLVTPRPREKALSAQDLGLLHDLAAQIGIALHAARAADDVLVSRAAVITAREEERRRIRRDLHDGLGPTLASLRLHLAALEHLIPTRPDDAAALVGRLRGDVAGTSAQVRELVYGLRPPMLDEFGLLHAIRSRADELGARPGIEVVVEAPPQQPELSAAVEVALYRIASEALANVGRHAGAARVCVRVGTSPGQVRLTVDDDGRGLPEPLLPGVGLAGMRERAEELRGVLVVTGREPSGTRVDVVLPLDVVDVVDVEGQDVEGQDEARG